MRFRSIAIAAALCHGQAFAAPAAVRPLLLHGLFQDHAVFQRDRPIPIWGEALAGEAVTLDFDGQTVIARADRSGQWSAKLPSHAAGGPFSLTATTPDGARQTVSDILVGDVWLCSGQSNMEMSVSAAMNSWGEIRSAGDDGIRLLSVGHDTGFTPLTDFQTPVAWRAAAPDTVGDFSAACYFMGRDLRSAIKVPIGLVDASWGGTAINSWRSEAAIAAAGDAAEPLKILQVYRRDPSAGNRAWGALWQNWWQAKTGNPADRPWDPAAADVGTWKPVPSLTAWEGWGDPSLATFDGMLFYRTRVTLTAAQAAMPATLSAGWVDEVDQSWVNGVPVGNSYGPGSNRIYRIPAGALKAGSNTVVINALDTYGAGGLVGPPELRAIRFADGSSTPLTGSWDYRQAPKTFGNPPRAPWETNAGLSLIYNGMIAPLGGYGLRGAAWYQGESDADFGRGYAARLANMMGDWRRQFAAPDLPFLIVQLSSWGPQSSEPIENGFATIRDEERLAVAADPHAGLVVSVDLGDRDLHPPNKQDVGHRLARAARHVAYGEALTPSGPEVAAVRRAGDAVVVEFRNVDGRLLAYSAGRPIGFELCGPSTGSCRFADGAIAENTVTLSGASATDTRVRFCWGASPICNLYDAAGLAAGPFELAIR